MGGATYRGAAAGLVIAACSVVYADSWPKRSFGFAIGMGIAIYEWVRAQELIARRRSSRQRERDERQVEPDADDAG